MLIFTSKSPRYGTVKPQKWGTKGDVLSAIRHNAEQIGVNPQSIIAVFPLWDRGGEAYSVNSDEYGTLTSGATWDRDGVLSDASAERIVLSSNLGITGSGINTGCFLIDWEQTSSGTTTRHLLSANVVTYLGLYQSSSSGLWTGYTSGASNSGTYATTVGNRYSTAYNFGSDGGLRINGSTVFSGGNTLGASVTTLCFGSRNADSGRYLNGRMNFISICSEQHSDAIADFFYDAPYHLVQQVPQVIFFDVATGTFKVVTDTGSGADAVDQILASVPVSDTGTGVDNINQILASLSVLDTGLGTDSLAQLLAALTVSDTGTGVDALSQISVSVAVDDSGVGTEAFAQSASVPVTDSGSGLDALPGIVVDLSVTDTGSGLDAVSVITALLKTVTDAGSGVDSIQPITVLVPIVDSGIGTDTLSALSAIVSVIDSAVGIDSVDVSFAGFIGKLVITISSRQPNINFTSRQPNISFIEGDGN